MAPLTGGPAAGAADALAARFEEHRARLHAVAYRMLGSLGESEDAVQEAWLRLTRAGAADIENLGGWLTTVVGRICLDVLRSRTARREEPLEAGTGDDAYVPDPVVRGMESLERADPEREVMLADSVGLALLVVLETLAPAERLAFVLHDMFAVPFEDIAPVVERTPAATRQLASRARRRVQGASPSGDADRGRQREVVEAFLNAARGGDFDALVELLDPDVVLRADGGAGAPAWTRVVRGAAAVAGQAAAFNSLAGFARLALVNGGAGVVTQQEGRTPLSISEFTVRDGRIVEINILADRERLARLDVPSLPVS